MLGGEISLISESGQGSTFTLYLPQIYTAPEERHQEPVARTLRNVELTIAPSADNPTSIPTYSLPAADIEDDRSSIEPGDRLLLVIEDDLNFAQILLDMARSQGFKGEVRTPERLLDETTLFLHRVQAKLPAPKRLMLEQLQKSDPILANKKVLIVDDDIRNIFALTSVLERYQMQIVHAENGRDGITLLKSMYTLGIRQRRL